MPSVKYLQLNSSVWTHAQLWNNKFSYGCFLSSLVLVFPPSQSLLWLPSYVPTLFSLALPPFILSFAPTAHVFHYLCSLELFAHHQFPPSFLESTGNPSRTHTSKSMLRSIYEWQHMLFVFMSLDYFIQYVFHFCPFACEFHYSLQRGQIPLCTGAIFSFFYSSNDGQVLWFHVLATARKGGGAL